MATFQPLYFSGGRYSSATDRKMLAALVASETNGTRVSGVIPAGIEGASLKVSSAGANTISISTGLCLIHDSTAPNATSGMYLAGIEGSSLTRTFSTNNGTNTRTDSVYAVVDETSYTIIKKSLTTNVATLTTLSAHGFLVGETVSVNGVDEIFDGFYEITGVTSTTFSYVRDNNDVDITEVNVRAEVRLGSRWAAVTQKAISSNTVTLTLSTTTGEYGGTAFAAGDAGQVVTVKGVDSIIDGSHVLATSSSTSVTFVLNKPVNNVTATPSPAAVQNSSVAVARVPFAIKIDTGNAGTYTSKNKIRLATFTVPSGGGTLATVTDTRQFITTLGGVHYYNSTATAPAAAAGRLRYNTATNVLEYYTTSWNTILTIGTTSTTAAAGNHLHTGVYAATNHNHDGVYAPSTHTHTAQQISGLPEGPIGTCDTYEQVDSPVSVGTESTSTISVSTSTYTDVSGIAVTISLTAASFCILQWSCEATSGTNDYIHVAPRVSGNTTVSADASTGTTTHSTNASDGTAYNQGDYAVSTSTTGIAINGTRLVKLNSGSNTVTLRAKRGSANGTIRYPVLRVIPIRYV